MEITIFILIILLGSACGFGIGIFYRKKVGENLIGSAEQHAILIKENAKKEAETLKKENLLELKENSIKAKGELEEEARQRRNELKSLEDRLVQKELNIDKKINTLEKKEEKLQRKLDKAESKLNEADKMVTKQKVLLEDIAGLTREEAKEQLLTVVEDEIQMDIAKKIKDGEQEIKLELDKKSKELVSLAVQKCAVDHVAETTVSVVNLPNEEMKGRIIGREGRNIRTLESLTGVDFIIDDTPEVVILSSFDPMRREIARIALEKLVLDGRVQPAKIEEMVEKATKEVNQKIKEDGERAIIETGIRGLHPELIKLVGRLRFRTSYGQNILKHSIEVAHICGVLASELKLDVNIAKKAGLLHDIGKAIDQEMEGSHVEIGVNLAKKYKESKIVINAIESHHGDVEPNHLISVLAQTADAISASRTGARRETLDNYTKRLEELENIAESFKGVEKSFAIQAGREVRIAVVPDEISDAQMTILARKISKKIEDELEYPGQVKVNLIRETRTIEYAK